MVSWTIRMASVPLCRSSGSRGVDTAAPRAATETTQGARTYQAFNWFCEQKKQLPAPIVRVSAGRLPLAASGSWSTCGLPAAPTRRIGVTQVDRQIPRLGFASRRESSEANLEDEGAEGF